MVWKSVDCGRSWTLPPATMLESGGRGTVGSGAFLQANTSVSKDRQAMRIRGSGVECEIDSGAALRRVNFADPIHDFGTSASLVVGRISLASVEPAPGVAPLPHD